MAFDEEALLLSCPLFAGMKPPELRAFLAALRPRRRAFAKGEALLHHGSRVQSIGILLEGRAEAQKTTPGGGCFTVTRLAPGSVYGDILFGGGAQSPVGITALSAGRVLLLPYGKLFSPAMEGQGGPYTLFLKNLLRSGSEKYFALDARLDLLLLHGLRRRVAAWLLGEAARLGSESFTTPHTRASLAAFLGCERSALSREISRMAKDGLLKANRGHFSQLNMPGLRRAAGEAL